MKKGKFIVLEGTDGSGKTVQFQHLFDRLIKQKIDVRTLDFPRYGKPSSYFVEQYLKGNYGSWEEVGAYRASLFYALDRFATSSKVKKWLKQGKIVLSNRYVGSNLGHQGVKIKGRAGRERFFKWVNELEYKILYLPKPDINIFLHMPAKIAYSLVDNKGKREYLGCKKRDIHEQDIFHIKQAEKVFCEVVKLFPKEFTTVECVEKGKLLSIEKVEEKIWRIVKRFLK
ncbi:MAG: hypothetical protein H8E13_10430 [Actinobacteria bacterium]|nr:hypothetical protein [Actinomycetota bacterium]